MLTLTEGQPLIRASLVAPFCERLEAGGADLDAVLAAVGLSREIVSNADVFAPASMIYAFTEEAAKALDDPFLGVRIGLTLSPQTWPPQREAAEGAETLAEYFTRSILLIGRHAGATRHELTIAEPYARLRYKRRFDVGIVPAQINAMGVGSMLTLLRSALRDDFDPRKLTVRTPAPEVAIAPECASVSFARGEGDTVFSFPAEWLTARLSGGFARVDPGASRPPADIPEALRALLRSRIGDGAIPLDHAARLLGRSPYALKAALGARGLTYRAVLDEVRREAAIGSLRRHGDVSATAERLGYENVANFSRAFRRWTGQSPSAYMRGRMSK